MKVHLYQTQLRWTGNKGKGTSSYQSYARSHTISVENKPDLFGSSDPSFRGDAKKYNPEELLVASLSACHMLWYLHLCSGVGIVVTDYMDKAIGKMEEYKNGSGKFDEVKLHPEVTIIDNSRKEEAILLHAKAHEMCFIANSMNFPVRHEPTCIISD